MYNLLLMVLGDNQKDVDDFIMHEAPSTPQTPSLRPHANPGELETVFTRLRNELGHARGGVNLDKTKIEMAMCVRELAALTKKAIQSHS